MTIGEKIKAARERAGLTQEELGKKCSTTKQTIYKYETGKVTNIPIDRLELIAQTLDVSSSFLLGWDKTGQLTDIGELSESKKALYDIIDVISEDQAARLLHIARAALDL